jgi:hypothetical protein
MRCKLGVSCFFSKAVVICAPNRSHSAINSPTWATLRCCSARGGTKRKAAVRPARRRSPDLAVPARRRGASLDISPRVSEERGFTGCGKTLQCGHPEPVRCHSERSEESRSAAQGKLRGGSRSIYFQGHARFFLRKAQDRRCSSAETRRVSPWNSAGVARTCFLGPRFVPDGQGNAADLKNRSALPFLGPSFCPSWAAASLSMLRMTALSSFSAACLAPPRGR